MATAPSTTTETFASPHALALRELLAGKPRKLAAFEIGRLAVELVSGPDAVFAVVRRPGDGGLALRLAYMPGSFEAEALEPARGEAARVRIRGALGEHLVSL